MTSHRWFAGLAALGVLVAGFFLVRSLDDDLVYFLTVDEAIQNRSDFAEGRAFRLSGTVVSGSVESLDGGTTDFQITDGTDVIDIRLVNTPPPLFDEGAPVLLSGAWDGQVFRAEQALIRHDENYSTPSTGNYPD